jgi:glycosyltransferase involved in cell wall biosynthesis
MKDFDIVVVSIQPWDIEIGSNCKNIALGMSVSNRVLYVNLPLERKSYLFDRRSKKVKLRRSMQREMQDGLVSVGDNLWTFYPGEVFESSNFLPEGGVFNWVNGINATRLCRAVKYAIEKLGFRNIVLFNDSVMFLGKDLIGSLNPVLSVYYIRDNLVNNPYWRKHGIRLESELIRVSDLVLTNSEYYRNYAAGYNPMSFMVGQGCELDVFDYGSGKVLVAPELEHLPRPIVGYVGHLSSRRLDVDLLMFLADSMSDITFVFVGKEDKVFEKSALHSMGNVKFFGHRLESEMPGFILGFDVAINPQSRNLATVGNYPRKVDEYLAMGRPVVCTRTDAMGYFEGYVYLAVDKADFKRLILEALSDNSDIRRLERRRFALEHTWDNCVAKIFHHIDLTIEERKVNC